MRTLTSNIEGCDTWRQWQRQRHHEFFLKMKNILSHWKTFVKVIWMTNPSVKEYKHGVLSGPYFPAFGLNTWIYGPKKTPYLDTFHTLKRSELTINKKTQNNQALLFFLSIFFCLRYFFRVVNENMMIIF